MQEEQKARSKKARTQERKKARQVGRQADRQTHGQTDNENKQTGMTKSTWAPGGAANRSVSRNKAPRSESNMERGALLKKAALPYSGVQWWHLAS
jgi:hypothetical protein